LIIMKNFCKLINAQFSFCLILLAYSLLFAEEKCDTLAVDLEFAGFLMVNHEYEIALWEYNKYCYENKEQVDSEVYRNMALCHHRLGRTPEAVKLLDRINPADSLRYLEALRLSGYLSFRIEKYTQAKNYFRHLIELNSTEDNKKIQFALKSSSLLEKYDAMSDKEVENYFHSVDEIIPQFKKPFLASLFSALIPGSGKLYAGRGVDALSSLTIVGITSWQACSSFNDEGVDSVKGWIYGSMASVFYLGNIYGSNIAVQIYNESIRKEIKENVRVSVQSSFNF